MKLRLGQVLFALPLLREWLGGNSAQPPRFKVRTTYRLLRLREVLDSHLRTYQESVNAMLAEQKSAQEIETALAELQNLEIEVPDLPILTIEELEESGIMVAVSELEAIRGWLLDEGQSTSSVQESLPPAST